MHKPGDSSLQRRFVMELIARLDLNGTLEDEELLTLLRLHEQETVRKELAQRARGKAQAVYGNQVYTRGLIEISNYCKNNCFYCGIRSGNTTASRYRLTKKDILACCAEGYHLGFRTFVLQGGEDPAFDDATLCDIVKAIRSSYPDCAITLSMGERSKESYQQLFDAGANRYLLRHETFDATHYSQLHPTEMSCRNRQECLFTLKQIGYQVGTGIMVGSPYQTLEHIVKDLRFIEALSPHMVGIGPFIPSKATRFHDQPQGSLSLTLVLLSILRLMLPHALIPSTTALGTIDPTGREQGILAGANVVMPNLSPLSVRKKYMLYENKICTGDESAQCRQCLMKRMESIGYTLAVKRGDYKE